ncbi:MAG: hypothetical protein EZS28_052218, partial [Streblomastix strix]
MKLDVKMGPCVIYAPMNAHSTEMAVLSFDQLTLTNTHDEIVSKEDKKDKSGKKEKKWTVEELRKTKPEDLPKYIPVAHYKEHDDIKLQGFALSFITKQDGKELTAQPIQQLRENEQIQQQTENISRVKYIEEQYVSLLHLYLPRTILDAAEQKSKAYLDISQDKRIKRHEEDNTLDIVNFKSSFTTSSISQIVDSSSSSSSSNISKQYEPRFFLITQHSHLIVILVPFSLNVLADRLLDPIDAALYNEPKIGAQLDMDPIVMRVTDSVVDKGIDFAAD